MRKIWTNKEDGFLIENYSKIIDNKDISKILSRTVSSIKSRANKLNIVKYPEIQFSKNQLHFFDGFLAGDGSINSRGSLVVRLKYLEFASYINNYLKLNQNIKRKCVFLKDTNKYYESFYFFKSNLFFKKEFLRWYKNGIKMLPSDFRFSPVSMLSLYLCDGSLQKSNNIMLHLQSFSRDSLEDIIIKNLKNIGVGCWVLSTGQIRISAKSKDNFLNYIGSCPVDCYRYRWDYNDVSKEHKKIRQMQSDLHNGKLHTNESKNNMRKSAEKRFGRRFLVYKNDIFIGEWITQRQCSRDINISQSKISKCLRGIYNTYKGYGFKYK